MDPVACALEYLTTHPRHIHRRLEYAQVLREWIARGGFRPLVEDIGNEARRRGIELPAGWPTIARSLGAAG